MRSAFRAVTLAAIGTLICSTLTVAHAGSTARVDHSSITVTKQVDKATPKMYSAGSAMSFNAQPLLPRQNTVAESFVFQSSVSNVVKGMGDGLSQVARKQ